MIKQVVFIISAVLIVAQGRLGTPLRQLSENCGTEFAEWLENYEAMFGTKKTYIDSAERSRRQEIFCENCVVGDEASAREAAGADFRCDRNPFADMDPAEIAISRGFRARTPKAEVSSSAKAEVSSSASFSAPAEFTWEGKGVVGPVVAQQSCGSCWAFATAAACEGNLNMKYGNGVFQRNLSEAWLKDCTVGWTDDDGHTAQHGCSGGNMEAVMEAVIKHDAVWPSEEDPLIHAYQPTDNVVNPQCGLSYTKGVKLQRFSASQSVYTTTGEAQMIEALVQYGPLVVVLDGGSQMFNLYTSGIIQGSQCSFSEWNHAVALIGYTTSVLTLKNSWGTGWGENGYFRVARGGCLGIGYWADVCIAEYAPGDGPATTTQAPTDVSTQAPTDLTTTAEPITGCPCREEPGEGDWACWCLYLKYQRLSWTDDYDEKSDLVTKITTCWQSPAVNFVATYDDTNQWCNAITTTTVAPEFAECADESLSSAARCACVFHAGGYQALINCYMCHVVGRITYCSEYGA